MFWIPACAVLVGALLLRLGDREGAQSSAILFANWAACAGFWYLTGEATEWLALAAFDYVAALALILFVPFRRPVIMLVAIYAAMLLSHVAYGSGRLLGFTLGAHQYFATLTALAWAQMLVLGGWGLVVAYRTGRARRDPVGCAQPSDVVSKQ